VPRPTRQAIYERLERVVADLEQMGGLPTVQEARTIWEGIWQEEAHHSTAVEGNTLLRREVQLLLFEGRAIGGRELREYLEVQGYADAAMWVYGQAVRRGRIVQDASAPGISLAELREIHRLVVEPVWARFPPADLPPRQRPGDFRRADVEPLRRGLRPPSWPEVHPRLTDWVNKAGAVPTNTVRVHLMEDLAELHAEFERIHPFPDGNGRVGRLTLNLLLVRHGYPPAVINKRDRNRYLDGLHRADEGDPGLLGEVLARSVEHGINRFLIPGLAGPHRWVPLASLVDAGLSYNALILAAQRGRLRAELRNNRWYSSRAEVEEYKRSRYKRRRSKKD
jgi:cell filamentation protein, protein adenylyltransferase